MAIKTVRSVLFGALILSLLVSACGGGDTSPAATATPRGPGSTVTSVATAAPTATQVTTPAGQLRMAIETIAGYSLLPGVSVAAGHIDIMFDPMIALRDDGGLEPKNSVVSSWTSSADFKTWTVKTRDGVVFHNGAKATAKDLKFTLDFYMHSGSNATATSYTLRQASTESIASPDDSTVVYTLKTADIFFPYRYFTHHGIGTTGQWLQSKAHLEAQGVDLTAKTLDLSRAVKAPVGSGPYRYVSDAANQETVMEAIPQTHWLWGMPRIKTATIRIIPEPATRLALVKSGEVETSNITRAPIPEMKRLGYDIMYHKDARNADIQIYEQWKDSYAGSGKNPLADVRVRQALSLAIDRKALVDQFLLGYGTPEISPARIWDLAYQAKPVPPQDLNKAKALLQEAGFANGFTLTEYQFGVAGLIPEGPDMMEAIALWWERLGIKVERKGVDQAATMIGVHNKGFSAPTVSGIWGGGNLTVSAGARVGSDGKIARGPTPPNHLEEDIDNLNIAIGQAASREEYTRAVRQWADISMQKVVVIPVFNWGHIFAVKKGLGGDKWNVGRGGNGTLYNLNQLLTGRFDILR